MTGFWSIFLKMDPSGTPNGMAESGRVRFLGIINARWKTLVKYGIVVHLGNRIYDITRKESSILLASSMLATPRANEPGW